MIMFLSEDMAQCERTSKCVVSSREVVMVEIVVFNLFGVGMWVAW